jgi:hypothetical protein
MSLYPVEWRALGDKHPVNTSDLSDLSEDYRGYCLVEYGLPDSRAVYHWM